METTISLTPELAAALTDAAERTSRPRDELVHEALSEYLSTALRPRPSIIGIIKESSISSTEIEDWLDRHWDID